MILFSIGGSTYGMAEETIPFYGLLSATMVAAGFDTFVAVGTVLWVQDQVLSVQRLTLSPQG